MPQPLPLQPWHRPGEPRASLYTPDWIDGMRMVEAMRAKKRKQQYIAFFAHLAVLTGQRIQSILDKRRPLVSRHGW